MSGEISATAQGRRVRAIVACGHPNRRDWVHEAPEGSAVRLVEDPGPRVALVIGPTHSPYYLLENGEAEKADE